MPVCAELVLGRHWLHILESLMGLIHFLLVWVSPGASTRVDAWVVKHTQLCELQQLDPGEGRQQGNSQETRWEQWRTWCESPRLSKLALRAVNWWCLAVRRVHACSQGLPLPHGRGNRLDKGTEKRLSQAKAQGHSSAGPSTGMQRENLVGGSP